jgi:hypothetical protein
MPIPSLRFASCALVVFAVPLACSEEVSATDKFEVAYVVSSAQAGSSNTYSAYTPTSSGTL